ncbi:hypothetical protein ACPSKX_15855 [Moritella viscosa]
MTTITTKKFKFTNANLKSLPSNPANSSSTELKLNDYQRVLCSSSIEAIG